jgi:hypothetical protein
MPSAADPISRAELRRRFAARLHDVGLALELLAEDVLGDEDQPIDWIAAAPDGRAWLVLIDTSEGSLVERALVQRAWVSARIPDWRQLAPSLGLRDGLVPGVLLVASAASRALRVAVREAFGDGGRLVEWSARRDAVSLRTAAAPPLARSIGVPDAAPLRSAFRTGLTDADLAN